LKIPQTLNTYNFSTNEKLLSPLSNTSYVTDVLDIDRKKLEKEINSFETLSGNKNYETNP